MKSVIKKVRTGIATTWKKVAAPVVNTKQWKFLRRTILRSPFRGYFVSAWKELKNVTWPNRRTTWKFTLVVITFSLVFAIFTASLDYGFEALARSLFLN